MLLILHIEMFSITVSDKELILPWRETPEWNSQTLQKLKDFVAKYEPIEEINNILLLGQVGAGKSSFINTINSVFKDEISSRACIGSENNSITKKIRDHSTKKYLRFRICDTRGGEEGLSIDSDDLGFILDGHLPNHYKINLKCVHLRQHTHRLYSEANSNGEDTRSCFRP